MAAGTSGRVEPGDATVGEVRAGTLITGGATWAGIWGRRAAARAWDGFGRAATSVELARTTSATSVAASCTVRRSQ